MFFSKFNMVRASFLGLLCIGGIFFLLGVSGCKSGTGSGNAILNISIGGEPTHLNPILSTDVPSSTVEGLIFNGLFRVDVDLSIVPDLVSTYSISKDGLTYTFLLHPNVTWHDGQPFTSEDVIFTFQKILDPTTNTVRRSGFVVGGRPIEFKALNSHAVTATLAEPYAPFLSRLTIGIVPRHVLVSQNINTAPFNRQPIGTGPFKFDRWETGQYVSLSKNTAYFKDGPKLDGVIAKIIPDSNTALVALEKQEIDSGKIPFKDVEKYRNHPHLDTYEYQDLMYIYLGFNLKKDIFRDVRVRQALAHALDKQGMTDRVLKGHGGPAHVPSSPVSFGYPPDGSYPIFEYNPTKSMALLDEAGWKLNPKTNVREKNGQPLSFTLITNQGNADRERTAQVMQQYFSKVGVKMSIRLMEWSGFIKQLNDPVDPKPFDAVMLGWALGIDPDTTSIWHSSEYPRGFNFIAYRNQSVDRLLDEGRRTVDIPKRQAVYAQLYALIAQDVPYLFLYYPNVITGINRRVTGLSEAGPAGLFNPIESITITP